jgi:hypothetical protein
MSRLLYRSYHKIPSNSITEENFNPRRNLFVLGYECKR